MKDLAKHNATQNALMKQRRTDWLALHGPCLCGSWEQLEVHHRDQADKFTHRIWSYCEEKRNIELAKCDALCRVCHSKHHGLALIKHGYPQYRKGCRCAECLAGWERYKCYANRKRRERRELARKRREQQALLRTILSIRNDAARTQLDKGHGKVVQPLGQSAPRAT